MKVLLDKFFEPITNIEELKNELQNKIIQSSDNDIQALEHHIVAQVQQQEPEILYRCMDIIRSIFGEFSKNEDISDKANILMQFYLSAYELMVKPKNEVSNNEDTPLQRQELENYISEQTKEAANNVEINFDTKIDLANKKIDNIKDSIILLTVTVLGIFSSLTFSLSGSLSLLTNVFNENNDSFAEALCKYALIGFFVANLVFLLIYCISRLNNKSIAMHCGKCSTVNSICKDCENIKKKEINSKNQLKKKIKYIHTINCETCIYKNTSCLECKDKCFKQFCKFKNKFAYIFYIDICCLAAIVLSIYLGLTGHHNFVFTDIQKENEHTTPSPTESITIDATVTLSEVPIDTLIPELTPTP